MGGERGRWGEVHGVMRATRGSGALLENRSGRHIVRREGDIKLVAH